ncbi:CGNR zinc finger domain-containing protein [Rhizohabitans arisaemae]|uniref:CGNR zinc finger domain-containing protein n=1 Tax=Rhizohabitans arisaemae TaxID=2720610 RepID=UPI0024B0BDC1|nr:ABATE domain-containing protein [Rhizohabitans arisaemae]
MVVLQGRDGQRFRFDPGTLCLEFLLTGGEGLLAYWEQLDTADDLACWVAACSLGIKGEVHADPADLPDAKRLRAAVQRLAEQAADGRDPAFEPVLNEMAARPPLVPALGTAFERGWAEPVTCTQFLSQVARDAIEVFGSDRVGRVRQCDSDNCLLFFLDTSRPGARRWCSMDRCGNRQKLRTRRPSRENG